MPMYCEICHKATTNSHRGHTVCKTPKCILEADLRISRGITQSIQRDRDAQDGRYKDINDDPCDPYDNEHHD